MPNTSGVSVAKIIELMDLEKLLKKKEQMHGLTWMLKI